MAKLNTNGNVYTIVYAAVMVIIVAFLLAFVASARTRAKFIGGARAVYDEDLL